MFPASTTKGERKIVKKQMADWLDGLSPSAKSALSHHDWQFLLAAGCWCVARVDDYREELEGGEDASD
jgi:hypothetical protein